MNRKIISKLPPFQPITQLKRYASNKMNEKKIMLENYIVRKKKKIQNTHLMIDHPMILTEVLEMNIFFYFAKWIFFFF